MFLQKQLIAGFLLCIVLSLVWLLCKTNMDDEIAQQPVTQYMGTLSLLKIFYPEINTNGYNLRKQNGVCIKGNEPFDEHWIKNQLADFIKVYNNRPVISNYFGTRIMHQFALWCFVKLLKPEFIIESGIYRGLGTWMLRQAAPQARIILLDPGNTLLHYEDKKYDTLYMTSRKFVDFKDVKWNDFVEPEKTLVFIDDHQNPIRRILEARKSGFRHLIFDDNYWLGQGDVISLKISCSLVLGELTKDGILYKDRIGHGLIHRNLTEEDLTSIKSTFDDIIEQYFEFPMIWNSKTANTNKDTGNFIFPMHSGLDLLKSYGLTNTPPPHELGGYFNIAYVKLKAPWTKQMRRHNVI